MITQQEMNKLYMSSGFYKQLCNFWAQGRTETALAFVDGGRRIALEVGNFEVYDNLDTLYEFILWVYVRGF